MILFGSVEAFDTINSDVRWAVMYGRGIHTKLIKIVRMGHQKQTPKNTNNGKIGSESDNNKGVSQGSPLSAYLFIIYDESTMGYYENSLKQETKGNIGSINTKWIGGWAAFPNWGQ